jgi:hypothetical protein
LPQLCLKRPNFPQKTAVTPTGLLLGRLNEADLGFARENDMEVSDHTGGAKESIPDFFLAVPSIFDRESESVNVENSVATGTRRHANRFA